MLRLVALALVLTAAFPCAAQDVAPARQRDRAAGAKAAKVRLLRPLPPAPRGAPIALRPVKPHSRAPGVGTVAYVTSRRAYLDAGSEDGLAPGQALALERWGRPAGTCRVEAVSDRSATCAGDDLHAGDTFVLARRAAPPAPVPKPLPSLLSAEETSRRKATVEAATVAQVDYAAPPRQEGPRELRRVEASLVHASFLVSDTAALHQERLEARVRGAELYPGWRLFLDATGVYRGASGSSARFRTGDATYLEARELQLASREPGSAFTVALGRVLPWSAPGSTVFDGAQVGWRAPGRELGIFGGAVPDVTTTGVTTSRATAGAYGAVEHASDDALVRGEGRLAVVRSPELGTRLEAEALAHAWLAREVDVSGQARLGVAGDRTAPAGLDAARLDLGARLAQPLWITGSVRYVGLLVPVTDLAAPALFPGPARHADLTASWDLSRALTLRATGGYAKDLGSGLDRGYAGPEVALPRLFGRYGGIAAGWLEERGWASGRSIWLQAQGDALWGMRLLLRGSLFIDGRPAPLSDESTLGLVASASKDLAPWLRFRLSSLGRLDLSSGGGGTLGGISVLAGLDGLY